jgi:hypothetical protein
VPESTETARPVLIDQTGLIYCAGVQNAAPGFLRLAGHPLRWQSLVSYHLGRLRAGGLVSARRSSADGRDSYYRIELSRCRELLAETGLALHPGLGPGPTPALFLAGTPPLWVKGGTQFLNAAVLGQITPGPVVQTVSAVG